MDHEQKLMLKPGNEIADFIELSMKPGTWAASGIPEHGCRLRTTALEAIIGAGGQYDADELLYGLMDWLDVTDDPLPAIATLRLLLDRHYPTDGKVQATCHFADEAGLDRRFIVGSVDTGRELVTFQRENLIFGLGQASTDEPGRIVIAAPLPLPLKAALRILSLSIQRFMNEPFDSFRGAVSASGATGNLYAWDAGELTTCHWPHGLGLREYHGVIVDCSDELYPLPPSDWLTPNQIATLVGIGAG